MGGWALRIAIGGLALIGAATILAGLTGALRQQSDDALEGVAFVVVAEWLETNSAMERAGYYDCPRFTLGLGRTDCGEIVAPGRYLAFDFTDIDGAPAVSARFVDIEAGELQAFSTPIAPGYPRVLDIDEDGDLDLVLPREGHPAIWRQEEDGFWQVPIGAEPARSI